MRNAPFLVALPLLLLLVACGSAAQEDDRQEAQAFNDRMAEEHGDDEATTSPGAEVPPAGPVTRSEVTYAEVDGTAVRGVLARPAGAADDTQDGMVLPGVIVIHEWWGRNDNVVAMAERLAAEGYQALAVDLYGGEVAEDREQAMSLMRAATEHPERLEDNLRQAYTFLGETRGAPRVGVIGWCFGGGWSLRTALALPRAIDATVIFYGRLVSDREALATLEMPILGLFGSEDGGIPVADVRAFEQTLQDLGKDVSVHVYEGADHAFANPTGGRYDEAAAEDAWAKTLAFFAQHLKSPAP